MHDIYSGIYQERIIGKQSRLDSQVFIVMLAFLAVLFAALLVSTK